MNQSELRREARMRKILQNSEERLRKITSLQGTKSYEPDHVLNGGLYTNSIDAHDSIEKSNNYEISCPTSPKPDVADRSENFLKREQINIADSVLQTPPIQHLNDGFKSNVNFIFANYRTVNVVAIAILARFIHFIAEFFLETSIGNLSRFIFSPLIVYHITEFLVIDEVPVVGMLSLILLLSNKFGKKSTSVILNAISVCQIILQDATLYFFVFIFCDKIINIL